MPSARAVFLDRDGVMNALLYLAEHGRVDTPLTPEQLRLLPGVAASIRALQTEGFRVMVVSNQPGIAKGQLTPEAFGRLRERLHRLLAQEGVHLDGEYYCLHHPAAVRRPYRTSCDCRKPHPGLILRALKEGGFRAESSFMVGDGLVDVAAGQAAGCRTVLIGHLSSLLSQLMERKRLYPSYLAESLHEAVEWIVQQPVRNGTATGGARRAPPQNRRRRAAPVSMRMVR